VFDPQLGDPALFEGQIHDFNPGVLPSGLFWTILVPESSVRVSPGATTAKLQLFHSRQLDHFDFENAILANGPTPQESRVSFKVRWTATGPPQQFDNPAQQFRGVFREALAQMEWTARSGDLEFRSAPLGQSSSSTAQIGRESNGSFY
jgi:hypothetical protein